MALHQSWKNLKYISFWPPKTMIRFFLGGRQKKFQTQILVILQPLVINFPDHFGSIWHHLLILSTLVMGHFKLKSYSIEVPTLSLDYDTAFITLVCLLRPLFLICHLGLLLLNSVKGISIKERSKKKFYCKILFTCLSVQHLSLPPSPVQSQQHPLEPCKK